MKKSDLVTRYALGVCRLKPYRRSRLYVEVYVYPTLRQLRAAGAELGVEAHAGTKGWCVSHRRIYPTMQDRFAQVGLARRYLGVNIVSHEMTHAGLDYLFQRRIKLPDGGAGEELCYPIGNLTSAFYRWAHRAGLVE